MNLNELFTDMNIRNMCVIIADTNRGLTKRELERYLDETKIDCLDDGSFNNGFVWRMGLSKKDWLYKCLVNCINKNKSVMRVKSFIERVMNPVNYTQEEKREQYNFLLEEMNKVLLLLGYEINFSGKIVEKEKAESLDEVDRRVSSLKKKLYDRNIHNEVKKYCITDYLKKDYFDTIFEATKGMAERIRSITGLELDGNELFQTAFSTKNPYIIFNKLETSSEKNEYNGLKELIMGVFHMIRNPMAHTPKINWIQNENETLDILTIISFVHKYLDNCYKNPYIK